MIDGLVSENVSASNIAVGSLTADVGSITGLLEATSSISAAEIEADAIGTSEQAFVGTGSPPAYVSMILHGSGACPSATSAWVVFGRTFGTNTPDVMICGNAAVTATQANDGSFLISGANGTVYYWAAFGSTGT